MKQNIEEVVDPKLAVEYYGADFPVDLLVRRIEEEDFIIPGFQRKYVWTQNEASKFLESLLIGLPTPALFLAKDKFSNKYIVIDGQQRLRTLQYFYREQFPDGKKFALKGVAKLFNDQTYSTLSPSNRRSLDNAIIHCIIISENYDPGGIFYLFERLNTTGTPLSAQEIRNGIYHGAFSDLIKKLSENKTWKNLYHKADKRAKEQEWILRFIALYFDLENYQGDMTKFLNCFMLKNKDLDLITSNQIEEVFISTIEFINNCLGSQAFYGAKGLNIVLYESLMILTANELKNNNLNCQKLAKFHQLLIKDDNFWLLAKQRSDSRNKLISRFEYVESFYQKMSR